MGCKGARLNRETRDTLMHSIDLDYNPVVTLNGWTLPFLMNTGSRSFPPHCKNAGWKRELGDGMTPICGATTAIHRSDMGEAVDGDRVRITWTKQSSPNTFGSLAGFEILPIGHGRCGLVARTAAAYPVGKLHLTSSDW